MSDIDRTDRKILKLLQEDGRITTVDLADRIGLSPTATSERLKRLLRERLHRPVSGRMPRSRRNWGCGLLVFVEVSLDKTTPDVFEQFAAAVRACAGGAGVPHGRRRASITWSRPA